MMAVVGFGARPWRLRAGNLKNRPILERMKANQSQTLSKAKRTVLMVDEHGRIRTIHRFHQKLRIGIALGIGALLVAAAAVWLYVDGHETQRELQQRIATLQRRVATAEQQQELLLARAVRAETQAGTSEQGPAASGAPEAVPVATPQTGGDQKEDATRAVPPAAEPAAASPTISAAAPTAPEQAAPPEPAFSVTVEKLDAVYQPSDKAIATEFTIRNTGRTPAQGRAVLVLSTAADATAPQLSLPSVPLNHGRPHGDRGSRFAIKHFVRLKIQRKVAEPGLAFDKADVFIFDTQGQLLQEKTFAVALRIPDAKPPEAAADSAPPPGASETLARPIPNSILAIPAGNNQETQGGQKE
jgi:hypothetical protein